MRRGRRERNRSKGSTTVTPASDGGASAAGGPVKSGKAVGGEGRRVSDGIWRDKWWKVSEKERAEVAGSGVGGP
jgi:hypothetical protein